MEHRKYWFTAFWILCAIIAFWLYYGTNLDPQLVGIVETRTHAVGAQEDGRVKSVLVEIGQQVRSGDIMARLDTSDLEAEKESLEKEVAALEEALESDKKRFSKEYARLILTLEARASDIREQNAELEAAKSELRVMQDEIKRQDSAEESGLGTDRRKVDLVAREKYLQGFIRELSKGSRTRNKKLSELLKQGGSKQDDETDGGMISMLADRMQRTEDIKRELLIVNERIRKRAVVAPTDGYVVDILAGTGDTMEAFLPIITVDEAKATYANLYLNEYDGHDIEVGYMVQIYSKRSDVYNTLGRVSFIHPGFSPIPLRFVVFGQASWARKITVKLPQGHSLLPGEAIRAEIVGPAPSGFEMEKKSEAAEAKLASKTIADAPILKMSVPTSLKIQSRFEPSGILWLDDLQRYLVISDDTGHKKDNNHAPWLFLMDEQGKVEAEPLVIEGIDSVNDLEAITTDDKGDIILVSSQSLSKKGKRKNDRQYIIRLKRQGRKLKVISKIKFYSLLEISLSKAEMALLGLMNDTLNIEATAWKGGDLYLGLKQPCGTDGAIIWRMKEAAKVFTSGKLQKDQLQIFGRVKAEAGGLPSGISDMAFTAKGKLLVLTTVPNVKNKKQKAGLHLVSKVANGDLQTETLRVFDGIKPEGLSLRENGELTIVFDTDKDTPLYLKGRLERK